MSLDVYLYSSEGSTKSIGSGIFIREDGEKKEITRSEWDDKFPGKEPFVFVSESETDCVYEANITHNLNTMAGEAGIYKHLWRPEELGITTSGELVEPLEVGLDKLTSNPENYKKFNPDNGWGNYEGLVRFVTNYLQACKDDPDATIYISR